LQRGICFANFTPRRKPLRRQAGSALPVNLALDILHLEANVRKIFLLCIFLVVSCSRSSNQNNSAIYLKASEVDGFDLEFDTSDTSAKFGFFGAGYAIESGYEYFTFQGKRYTSIGGGSALIQRIEESPAKYLVREKILSIDEKNPYKIQTIVLIIEKETRKLLAHREFSDGGWPGDRIGRFVHEVLKSSLLKHNPRSALYIYEALSGRKKFTATSDIAYYPWRSTPRDCPESISIDRGLSKVVHASSFEFLPLNPLRLVACDAGHLLVVSGVYGYELNLDLLTLDGEHVAQGSLDSGLPSDALWADVTNFKLSGNTVDITLLVNRRSESGPPYIPYGNLQVEVTLKCSHAGCGWKNPKQV